MLNRAPKALPPLSVMLDDLGRPSAAQVAATLDVSERTVWRWLADDNAPRPALLALFWLTSWGWSQVESDARSALALLRGLASAHQREALALAAENARLRRIGDFGSANDPSRAPLTQPRGEFRAPRPAPETVVRRAARRWPMPARPVRRRA